MSCFLSFGANVREMAPTCRLRASMTVVVDDASVVDSAEVVEGRTVFDALAGVSLSALAVSLGPSGCEGEVGDEGSAASVSSTTSATAASRSESERLL